MRLQFTLLATFFLLLCGKVIGQSSGDTLSCGFSCCNTYDPTPSGVMISHIHHKKEWMLSYRYMNMEMGNIQSGVKSVDKNDVFLNYLMAPKSMRMDMHMLMGMYGLTGRITLMAMLNYSFTSMDMNMFSAAGHHHGGSGSTSNEHVMNASGLGDCKIFALYGLIDTRHHQLMLSTGLSIPTGSIQMKGSNDDPMYSNQRLPYSMQMGSGTYDLLPCVNYFYQKNRVTYSAQISGIARLSSNSVGYRLGNEISSNVWFAYEWFRTFCSSIRFEANSMGMIKGYDPSVYYYNEPSSNPNNYGGERVNLYVGSSFQFKKGILKRNKVAAEYGIPLYQNLQGIQMPMGHTLNAAWSIMF
jgi:hypothetical protein